MATGKVPIIPITQGLVQRPPNKFATSAQALPPGWPPDVVPFQLIEADHINSLRTSVAMWPGDVDGFNHKLSNVVIHGGKLGTDLDAQHHTITNAALGAGAVLSGPLDAQGNPITNVALGPGATLTGPLDGKGNTITNAVLAGGVTLPWDGVTGKPSEFPPAAHTHEAEDITSGALGAGVTLAWGSVTGKPTEFPPTAHSHTAGDITSGVLAVARLGTGTPGAANYLRGDGAWASVDWSLLTGVPATFTPAAHVHSGGDITSGVIATARLGAGTPTASVFLRGDGLWSGVDWSTLTGVPGTFAPSPHVHSAEDITSGVMAVARLGTGTPTASVYLRGDGTWAAIVGGVSSVFGRGGAVVAQAGDYPPALLGTGTPDGTKFLRGDGTWALPPGGGGSQTPWTSDIDAAGYSLGNAGAAEFSPVAAYVNTDGVGLRIREYKRLGAQGGALDKSPRIAFFWSGVSAGQIGLDSVGTLRTFNQNGDGYVSFAASNLTVTGSTYAVNGHFLNLTQYPYKYVNGSNAAGIFSSESDGLSFYVAPPGTPGTDAPIAKVLGLTNDYNVQIQNKLLFPDGLGLKVQTYNGFGLGIEANCQYSITPGTCVHRWYMGTADGSNWKMQLSSTWLHLVDSCGLNTAGVVLRGFGGVALNIQWSDTWRYLSNGGGGYISAESDRIRFLVAPAGTQGAVASLQESVAFKSDAVFSSVPIYLSGGGRCLQIQGNNELDVDFTINNGGANTKRSRVIAYPGGIGLQTVDDAYTYCPSGFVLYTNRAYIDKPLCVTGNAIYAPSLNGLHLGFDGASGMVAALHDGVGWKPLYLRGSAINIEPQGSAVYCGGSVTQVLPMSQTDPGNFPSIGSAHYIYFDPGTKRLILRYHEYGVAYRNYILKEGTQGATLIQSAPGGVSGSSASRVALFSTIPVTAAGTYTVTFSVSTQCTSGSSNRLNLFIGARPVTITAGNDIGGSAPVPKQLFDISLTTNVMVVRTVTLTVTFDGTTYSFSGSWAGYDSGTVPASSFTKEAVLGFTFFSGNGSNNPYVAGGNLQVNQI